LSQQVDSLKTILTGYSEVEQNYRQNQQLVSGETGTTSLDFSTQSELSKSNRATFRAITARISSNLKPITDAINTSLKSTEFNQHCQQLSANIARPTQKITAQQTDLEQALLKLSQLKVSQTIDEDLETQSKQIAKLETTLGDLISLISKLNS
jgi:ribosome-binding ATPase YchF (GTP1/OBG family)